VSCEGGKAYAVAEGRPSESVAVLSNSTLDNELAQAGGGSSG
jgi:hypothetical protein